MPAVNCIMAVLLQSLGQGRQQVCLHQQGSADSSRNRLSKEPFLSQSASRVLQACKNVFRRDAILTLYVLKRHAACQRTDHYVSGYPCAANHRLPVLHCWIHDDTIHPDLLPTP